MRSYARVNSLNLVTLKFVTKAKFTYKLDCKFDLNQSQQTCHNFQEFALKVGLDFHICLTLALACLSSILWSGLVSLKICVKGIEFLT